MKTAKSSLMNWLVVGMILTTISIQPSQAQYNPDLPWKGSLALGLRVGGTSGITGKYFYKNNTAVEGILGGFGNGFSITGLIERQVPLYDVDGLFVYYGGGLHLAFYNGNHNGYPFGRDVDYRDDQAFGVGINGIVGLEYRLPDDIPIAFSFDLKPFVEVASGGATSVAPDPSFGLKFFIR